MKYEIRIIKILEREEQENDMMRGMLMRDMGNTIFNATMNSDHAIEILNHLYNLKESEK